MKPLMLPSRQKVWKLAKLPLVQRYLRIALIFPDSQEAHAYSRHPRSHIHGDKNNIFIESQTALLVGELRYPWVGGTAVPSKAQNRRKIHEVSHP